MNISFSLLERALVYGPEFIAALAAVLLLAAGVFPDKTGVFLRDKIYKLAMAAVFLACVFLFLYTLKDADSINGVQVAALRVLMLALGACLFVLLIGPDTDEAGPYVLCLAALASMHAAFLADKALMVLAAFITMDCAVFAAILSKKESRDYGPGLMPAKLLHALACAVFAVLCLVSGGKTLRMAQAGCVIFMMLFSTPGLVAMRGSGGEEGERFLLENSPFILFSGVITAVISVMFLSAGPEPAAARPVVIAAVILSCVNIYRAITEEKYQAFAAHDSINPVFLLPALACGAGLPGDEIALVSLLFMLSAFLQNEFIAFHDRGRHTVASLKYGFEKVKGGWLAFLAVLTGLAAEISVFILFYRYLKQDALIFAAVIFMALAFSVQALNKLFMLLSMLKRFRFNKGKVSLAIEGDFRPTAFIIYACALLVKWLR